MYIYNLGQKFKFISNKYDKKKAILIEEKAEITFEELEDYSNQIANFLLSYDIEKKAVIAIQNSKSKEGFAAMLACLKLGIIYTNFDYSNPEDRIKKIFETAQPQIIWADIYEKNIDELCRRMNIPYIVCENEHVMEEIRMQKAELNESVINAVSGDTPAYIMFTSGSTGIPKGVTICHRSLLNFIEWGKETYNLMENDIMTNVNPIYFDNSVFDFYCSIFNGITMVAIPKEIVEKPKQMLRIIDEKKCTFWFSVPSMLVYLTNLKLLSKDVLKNIRVFSFGGEGYPKEFLRKLYNIYCDTADFYNVYGPTEGTCICSAYKILEQDIKNEGLAPLGHIASNFNYLILDEEGKESTKGELYLLGEQLALGYYNDKERTEKSFIQCDKQNKYFERMYKTGDLVEVIEEKLYFRGRVDNQIKHMGYRIELEEIEDALTRITGIKECAVVHTLSKNNFSKIIAFVVMEQKIETALIKEEVRKYLPSYMIPNGVIFMDSLPKNANGKIDRNYLKRM